MKKKIEISYIPIKDKVRWDETFIDILSDGLYEYLKNRGLLKEHPEQKKRLEALLDKTKPSDEIPLQGLDSA